MNKLGLNSQADLEEAEFRAQGARFDLESWRAVVERTRADIRVQELELEKTRLRAPFDGVVARRYIRVGQNVLKDEKCFRFSQLAPLQVRFLVPETSAQHPRPGDEVRVALAGDAQRAFPARILKVSPTVDAASGSFEVTAQLSGGDLGGLRPGMAVRVVWPPGGSTP
jgi:membrane fusion protein (multidrug efflux system)